MINLRLYTESSINFLNRQSPNESQLTNYETYQIKNFNGNDHISNSIILDKDIDLRYVFVDGDLNDPDVSTFYGSYWYCVGKKFISRKKYQYTLRRDVFQKKDFLLANNNVAVTTTAQTLLTNDRWLTEDAFIERGIATNDLRYVKDNLPLNKIKVNQINVVPANPIIGIFYNQAKNDDGEDINFDLTGAIGVDSNYDYEYDDIEVGKKYLVDFNSITNKSVTNTTLGKYLVNQNHWISWGDGTIRINNLTLAYHPSWNPAVGSPLTYTTNKSDINWSSTSERFTYSTSGSIHPIITLDNNKTITNPPPAQDRYSNTVLETLIPQLNIPTSSFKQLVLDKYTYDEYTSNIEVGIIKVDNSLYRRTVKPLRTDTLVLKLGDIKPIIYGKGNTELSNLFDKLTNWADDNTELMQFNVPLYEVETTLLTSDIGLTKKIVAKVDYPLMANSPVKCIAVEYTLENWKWAVAVSKIPQVINVQLIKYPPERWQTFTKRDSEDTIGSIQIIEDDVSFTYTLSNPIGPGNKEYSMARITSGSFMSSFDIDLYNNNGLKEFNISYRLKPMQTTYYVQPKFEGLYGTVFNDKRGLIEQEDLSAATLDDAWLNAQYTNRNLFNSFNRQQESLQLEQSWQERISEQELKLSKDEAKLAQGNYVRNISGVGGIPLIGDLVGAIATGVGGHIQRNIEEGARLDHQMGQELRAEAYNIQQDMFNYNVGNIKALTPQVTRLDSLDNKTIFGFIIEIYETSQSEKAMVDNYKKWNSEPINTIGRFIDYIEDKRLIKGTLIRSSYPSQVLTEINQALKGGIYINGI